MTALEKCARSLVDALVVERIRKEVNREIVSAIKIGCYARTKRGVTIGESMRASIKGSVERVNEREQSLSAADLDKRVAKARKDLEKAIETGAWRTESGHSPQRRIRSLTVALRGRSGLAEAHAQRRRLGGLRTSAMCVLLRPVLPAAAVLLRWGRVRTLRPALEIALK
jgi:hypothetical protein